MGVFTQHPVETAIFDTFKLGMIYNFWNGKLFLVDTKRLYIRVEVVSISRLAAFYVVFVPLDFICILNTNYVETTNNATVSPSDIDVYEIQYNSYDVSINGEVHSEHTAVEQKRHKKQSNDQWRLLLSVIPYIWNCLKAFILWSQLYDKISKSLHSFWHIDFNEMGWLCINSPNKLGRFWSWTINCFIIKWSSLKISKLFNCWDANLNVGRATFLFGPN